MTTRRVSLPNLDSPDLLRWPDAQQVHDWTGLLIGNGASIACWDGFAYGSIYEQAREIGSDHPLGGDDVRLFDAFGTTNFEQILAALNTSTRVLNSLGYENGFIQERYESIQEALFDAIHSVHVPWGITADFEGRLRLMRAELENYDWIYSLNYDLILYWAITSVNKGGGIADFFWNAGYSFDPGNTIPMDYAQDWPKVVWIHGGIHLRRHIDGIVFKETADDGVNLLEKFKTPSAGDAAPLLVSEGTAEDKYRAITRSSYLEFALRSLNEHQGGLAIFGSSLRDEDQHLVRAMKDPTIDHLAISIRPSEDPSAIVERKASLRMRFPDSDLYFFDSTTHPLGSPSLKIVP